jgi:hypothetical protein
MATSPSLVRVLLQDMAGQATARAGGSHAYMHAPSLQTGRLVDSCCCLQASLVYWLAGQCRIVLLLLLRLLI